MTGQGGRPKAARCMSQGTATQKEAAMETKGAIATVFDFSFTEFITPRIIKFIFILAVVFSAIAALLLIVSGFRGGAVNGDRLPYIVAHSLCLVRASCASTGVN